MVILNRATHSKRQPYVIFLFLFNIWMEKLGRLQFDTKTTSITDFK